jgi:hypothetical protein
VGWVEKRQPTSCLLSSLPDLALRSWRLENFSCIFPFVLPCIRGTTMLIAVNVPISPVFSCSLESFNVLISAPLERPVLTIAYPVSILQALSRALFKPLDYRYMATGQCTGMQAFTRNNERSVAAALCAPARATRGILARATHARSRPLGKPCLVDSAILVGDHPSPQRLFHRLTPPKTLPREP